MAEVTAGMVKELREKTDAPMMECKKALAEADGNMGRAEEILRVKLGNKAAKVSTRIAAEGIVSIDVDASGKVGSIVEVNCETDFVAKNEEFQAFARSLAALVTARAPADVDALSALPLGGATSVEAARTARTFRSGALPGSQPSAGY
jgi:elongation factor Ts